MHAEPEPSLFPFLPHIAWRAGGRSSALLTLAMRAQIAWAAVLMLGTLVIGTQRDPNDALLFAFVVVLVQLVLLPLTLIAIAAWCATGLMQRLGR